MWPWKKIMKKKTDIKQTRSADLDVKPTKMNVISTELVSITGMPDMSLEESWNSNLIAHIVPEHECCRPDCPIAIKLNINQESGEEPAKQSHLRLHRTKFVRQGSDPTKLEYGEFEPKWLEISDAVNLIELHDTKAQIVSVEREESEIIAIRVRVWTNRTTFYDKSAEKWNFVTQETIIRLQPGESLLIVDVMDNKLGIYFEQEAFLFTLCDIIKRDYKYGRSC